jgi:hypothetical protein
MVVTGPNDLLPDQLTERLRASGALPFGRVTAIHSEERRLMLVSMIMPLRVEYSPDAPGEAPTRLLLKSSRDGLDAGLQSLVGEREVAFYTQAAPLMPGGPSRTATTRNARRDAFTCCWRTYRRRTWSSLSGLSRRGPRHASALWRVANTKHGLESRWGHQVGLVDV